MLHRFVLSAKPELILFLHVFCNEPRRPKAYGLLSFELLLGSDNLRKFPAQNVNLGLPSLVLACGLLRVHERSLLLQSIGVLR